MKTNGNRNPGEFRRLNYPVRLILAAFVISAVGGLQAAGRSAFPILQTSMDPRNLALGGACITETGFGSGAPINPAAAANSARGGGISFANHQLDLWSGKLTYSQQLPKNLTGGLYLMTFNYGEFDRVERGGEKTGTFSASENVFAAFSAGKLYKGIMWGVAAKFAWGKLEDEDAAGAALDFGLNWDTQWEQVKVGIAARNIGTQFSSYGKQRFPLPLELLLGVSYRLQHLPLRLHLLGIVSERGNGDYRADWLPGEADLSFAAGGEFDVSPESAKNPVFVRLGYHSKGEGLRVGHRLDTLAGFSFGVGIVHKFLEFGYTFAPMGSLGDVHRFGVSGTF